MMPLQSEIPVSMGTGSLPDENTGEAILYGSSYSRIKSIIWAWDEMEDYLIHKAQNLEGQIMDRKFCYNVLLTNRYLIFARSPPVNDVNQLKDLFTLRALLKCVAGIRKISEYRKQNLAWARKKGIEEYVRSLSGRGITEAEWKSATATYNMAPINYDYVHGLSPDMMPGEAFSWDEAMEDLMGKEAYDKLVSRMLDGKHVPPFMDVTDPSSEPVGDDVPDTSAEHRDDPEAKRFRDGVNTIIANLLHDPIKGSLSRLETSDHDPEAFEMSCYLSRTSIDNGKVIDRAICFAEELAP